MALVDPLYLDLSVPSLALVAPILFDIILHSTKLWFLLELFLSSMLLMLGY